MCCTTTPLMSLTPLNRSLHIYLFRFVDSYLSIFLVIYLKKHLSGVGVRRRWGIRQGKQPSTTSTSTDTPPPPLQHVRFSSPFKATSSWKAYLPRNLWDHFKFPVRVKELTFWERRVSESGWMLSDLMRVFLSLQMCMLVQRCVNKWVKVMLKKSYSWELEICAGGNRSARQTPVSEQSCGDSGITFPLSRAPLTVSPKWEETSIFITQVPQLTLCDHSVPDVSRQSAPLGWTSLSHNHSYISAASLLAVTWP